MNADIVGLQGEPFVMNIEQGKIRELARATFSSHPEYLESERPVAPVNILMTRFLWETDESDVWKRVGMDQHKGLHAEQFIEFTAGPPRAGDRLTGQHTIAESFTKWRADGARLDFVAMHSDFRADGGAVVGRMRTLSVEVNPGAGRSTGNSTTTTSQSPRRAADQPAPSESRTALPRWTVGPLTRTDIVRYAGASGDFQPVHHDEQFARDSGYDAPMAMGMLAAGAVATWATDRFGPRDVRTCRIRFTGKVFPGDTLVIDGTVAAPADGADGSIVRATCSTAAAGQVLGAELEFVGDRARRVGACESGTS